MEELFLRLFVGDRFAMGIAASLLTGFATGAGALPVFFTPRASKGLLDALPRFRRRGDDGPR